MLTTDAQQWWATRYDHLYRPLVDLLLPLTSDARVAEDVAQEAFVRAMALGPPAGPLLPQLVEIAAELAERDNRWRRRMAPLADAAARVVDGPDTDLAWRRRDAARALGRLPVGDQELLELRYVDGLAVEDVAALYQVDVGRLRRLLDAAGRRFQAAFEQVSAGLAALPGLLGHGWRWLWGTGQRTQGRLAGAWLRLDPLQAVTGFFGTAAVSLTLAAAVAVGGSTLLDNEDAAERTARARPAPVVVDVPRSVPSEQAAAPSLVGDGPSQSTPARARQTLPGITAQPEPGQTNYNVQPLRQAVPSDNETADLPFVVPPVDFECPDPAERPLIPAVMCPVLEASG